MVDVFNSKANKKQKTNKNISFSESAKPAVLYRSKTYLENATYVWPIDNSLAPMSNMHFGTV